MTFHIYCLCEFDFCFLQLPVKQVNGGFQLLHRFSIYFIYRLDRCAFGVRFEFHEMEIISIENGSIRNSSFVVRYECIVNCQDHSFVSIR